MGRLSMIACFALLALHLVIQVTARDLLSSAVSFSLDSMDSGLEHVENMPRSRKLQQSLCQRECGSTTVANVCGTNNQTYDNYCYAKVCNQTDIAYWGACVAKPCLCDYLTSYVCANGTTYLNPCFAACNGVNTTYTPGVCAQDCQCPNTTQPVTGTDGKLYNNACKALCAGASVAYSGPPDARVGTCKCNLTSYDPVCETTDMITYENPCLAACANVTATSLTNGSCYSYIYGYFNYEADAICDCPLVIKPVCAGADPTYGQTTYSSNCTALQCLNETRIITDGLCPVCICPMASSPVCVDDKYTYRTACNARCDGGATTWTEGPCKLR